MGAGCYYTLPDNRQIKAYWLDVVIDDDEIADQYDYDKQYLIDVITELPLAVVAPSGRLYYGKHYRIELDPTYNGDGILINLAIDLPEYDQRYGLTLANLERVYNRIIKHVNKSLPLRVASSGYTSVLIAAGCL